MNQKYEIPFKNIENSGLKYIKNQQHYIIFSAIFPIYSIVVQLVNIIYTLNMLRFPPPPPNRPIPIFDVLTPFFVLLAFSILALIKFIFLLIWNRKVKNYDTFCIEISIKDKLENEAKNIDNLENIKISRITTQNRREGEPNSLIMLLYDLIDHMRSIRYIFILLNVVFVLYFQWFIRFFLSYLHLIPPGMNPPNILFKILNTIAEFGILLYMIFEWRHFLRWNKKLKKIDEFEKVISEDLEI